MTGTAVTEAGEFWEIYKLDVVEIPPINLLPEMIKTIWCTKPSVRNTMQ
jgi:hypothetical protein